MGKRKCVVNEEMFREHPYFKRGRTNHDLFCDACNTQFSVANKGRLAVTEHISTMKHQRNLHSALLASNNIFVSNTNLHIRTASNALEHILEQTDDANHTRAISNGPHHVNRIASNVDVQNAIESVSNVSEKCIASDNNKFLRAALNATHNIFTPNVELTHMEVSPTVRNKILTEDVKYLRAAEGAFVYHSVIRNQSFELHDCDITVPCESVAQEFDVFKQMVWDRTTAEAIVNNVFAPHMLEKTLKSLERIPFITMSTYGTNCATSRLYPIFVQYFDYKNKGIQSKIIKIITEDNIKSQTVASIVIDTLQENDLLTKCIGFSGNNCNIDLENFSPKNLEMKNDAIEGIGCPLNVVSNAFQCGLNQLSVDAEGIVAAIHKYFSIFPVQLSQLSKFCQAIHTEYKIFLYGSKNKWPLISPSIEHILGVFDVLKMYFLTLEKPPILLKKFFENEMSECYLQLVHSYIAMFQDNIQLMERKENSVLEVNAILERLSRCLHERIRTNFVPMKVRTFLQNITEPHNADKFKCEMKNMYVEALTYIKTWAKNLEPFKILQFMELKEIPQWNDAQQAVDFLMQKGVAIDDGKLFDQFVGLKDFVSKKMKDERWSTLLSHEKWTDYFNHCESGDVNSELLKIAQYVFSISAYNANVEHVFSIIANLRIKNGEELDPNTANNILLTWYNVQMDCKTFYEYLLKNPSLLEMIDKNHKPS